MIVSSVFHGAESSIQPQSLVRVRDPVRIAEGPTAIDAATQRRHFGFRLRLVDNLQPIGGAWQRPRRENGKRRVFALQTAQTRPMPRFRSLHEVCKQGIPLHVANDLAWIPIKGKPANIQGRILGEKPGVFAFFCWIWLCSRES